MISAAQLSDAEVDFLVKRQSIGLDLRSSKRCSEGGIGRFHRGSAKVDAGFGFHGVSVRTIMDTHHAGILFRVTSTSCYSRYFEKHQQSANGSLGLTVDHRRRGLCVASEDFSRREHLKAPQFGEDCPWDDEFCSIK